MQTATELVIFDCDGVLVDSERIAVKIDQAVFAAVGITMTEPEIIERFVGRSVAVVDAAIEEHLGHPIPGELRQQFDALYHRTLEAELTTVDGIEQALELVSHPICVASSSEPASLRHKLALTGLLPHFEGRIYSASQVERGKPAPDLFQFAAAQMGAPAERCVVVEDSKYGVEAALAANMRVFAYTGGITSPDTLRKPGAVLFDDMRELPRLIGKLDTA